jgi:hypothetical protein
METQSSYNWLAFWITGEGKPKFVGEYRGVYHDVIKDIEEDFKKVSILVTKGYVVRSPELNRSGTAHPAAPHSDIMQVDLKLATMRKITVHKSEFMDKWTGWGDK